MAKNKIIIIGGGASGLMAAIVAARRGAKVTLLERKDRVGKKILATGNGRCNMTNVHCTYKCFHGGHHTFIEGILKAFNVTDTMSFFQELGIHPTITASGKVYPRSLQAGSVLDVLRHEVERLKVTVLCDEEVIKIEQNKQFVVYTKQNNKYYGHKIILATGGKSTPDLGSNGTGYELAKAMGHTVIRPIPSLVQLKSDAPFLKQLKGVKITGKASILDERDHILREEYGEILFTDYGVSGPPILQVSRIASDRINNNKNVYLSLDLMSDLSKKELDKALIERLTGMPYKTIQDNFIGFINKRMIPVLLKETGIAPNKKAADISKQERQNLVIWLKGLKLHIHGTHQWNQSQVTAGGVKTTEIDHQTLESNKMPGIYYCGELLDVDGDCGGYNLQWAWSSGYVAAVGASQS
ncbi:NAD(P)/FAD-dependent oxidoreductase [Vallitalea pronyensis]|uniref:NAD(P)/FAD-dependent oxidoreductase n=1 Tax=Vallitalea pronyensis TaxID=1348613 RepID=A0A8J8ML69_9FIRM|nr:NAD(P)/FAD-dependent oxidoreductase [Vallitalea pronyensis]QUI23524.1 NAD(P)/FAD-dependent oxidoreductase [Vallitalea pronyensis]